MKAGRRASPWFWQILATIGAVPVCALMLHFLVVLAVQPAPLSYSLDAITSSLGSGIAAGELDVQVADPPLPSQQGGNARALGLALRVVRPSSRGIASWQGQDLSWLVSTAVLGGAIVSIAIQRIRRAN